MILQVLALLSAQTDWRWSATDPIIVGPAGQKEEIYRDCLAENAAMLSQDPDDDAEILASVAFGSCSEENDIWHNARRAELKAARPRITDASIDDQLRSSHLSLLAWTEGMIFALQRGRYWKGRPYFNAPLRKKLEDISRMLREAGQPPTNASPRK